MIWGGIKVLLNQGEERRQDKDVALSRRGYVKGCEGSIIEVQ